MASKYELSLSKDYVSSWTVQDGVREFLQNAIDQETVVGNNVMSVKYLAEEQRLLICNESSRLETSSLLLGATTKARDIQTIGCFGEGYKVALLVLTRNNKPVTIYNYGAREVWTSRFVKSRRYGAEVLTIFVDKEYPWKEVPNNDLTIAIDNFTEDDWNETKERALFLQEDIGETLDSTRGKILLDPKYQSKVFVNGLFVSEQDLEFGYNIKPQYLKIGRDRNLVNSFDIQWETSAMWSENNIPQVIELIRAEKKDVLYLNSSNYSREAKHEEIAEKLYEDLEDEYEEDSMDIVYVDSQEEAQEIQATYDNVKPVYVSTLMKELIENNIEIYKDKKENLKPKGNSTVVKYNIWKTKYSKCLSKQAMQELDNIMKELKLL